MNVSVRHPNNRANYCTVYLGGLMLHFSYETIVGFSGPKYGTVASENLWGPTTGKHLNMFSNPNDRIGRDDFEYKLQDALEREILI